MAQLLTVRLSRNDSSTSWGFRLQGGKDFNTPLLIQKVNVGSLAERAGLQVGDAVIRVNGKDVADVRHKDAQDIIVRAGNLVEFTIQRGGTVTWKPAVTPVGSVPSPNPYISTSPSPVTKTSLASSPHQSPRIPQGFNSASKPFSPQQTNGGYVNENGSIKAIVNKQYNTPVGIYSDESIAETLSAQAEVLAGGVLGVNFKKNEKNYNAENSEVFKMVLEAEKEPKSPEPERPSSASYFASLSHAVGGQATSSRPQTPTAASLDRPRSITSSPLCPVSAPPPSAPDNLTCSECRQNIVGVFVRIKEKNLHVECFKCATCGTSLKNVGYYTINNKLYCDIHAKMVARQNPPAPNLEPVTVSPSQHGASKIISTALIANSKSAPLSPQPTLAPVPFHPPRQSPTHVSSPVPHSQPFSAVNGSKSYSPSNTFSSPISAPKPGYFQSQKALPFSKDTHKPTPSPLCSSETQPVSYYNPSQRRLPFLKPRAEKASAFMPVMKSTQSKPAAPAATTEPAAGHGLSTVFESYDQDDAQMAASHRKKLSICSQEVKNVFSRHLAGSPALSDRPESPVPSESANEFQHYETPRNKTLEAVQARPHSVRSLSPCDRPATPSQTVVFPPEMPACYHPRVASPLPIYSKPRHESRGDEKSDDEIGTCGVKQKCQIIEPRDDEDDEVCKCIIEKTTETLTITCVSPVPAHYQANKPEPIKIYEVTTWQSQPRPATPPRGSIPRKEGSEGASLQSRSRPETPSRSIPHRKISEVASSQSQPRPDTPSRCSSLPREVSGGANSQSRPRPTTPSKCNPHKEISEGASSQGRPRPETPPRSSIPRKAGSEVSCSQSRPRSTTPLRCISHKNAPEFATLQSQRRPETPPRCSIPRKEVSEVATSQRSQPRPETPPRYMISHVTTSQSQPRPATPPRCTLPREESEVATLQSLPRPATPPGFIASLLTTASDRPFTPIEPAKATIFTEPVPLPPETIPYLPTSKEESHRLPDSQRPMSPMTFNLTIASERSYSPLPTVVKFEDLFPPGAEPPVEEEPTRPSLAAALTVAPSRSYTPLSRGLTEQPEKEKEKADVKVPDLSEDPSVILTRPTLDIKKTEKDTKKAGAAKPVCVRSSLIASPFYVTEAAFPPICDELKAKFEKRLRTGSISDKNVHKSVHAETAKEVEEKRPARSPFTPTGLYKPVSLPHYQQCVKELASRNKTPLSRRNTPTPKMTESRKNTPTPRADLSRKNTPTPRADSCRKPTPIGFEATVSTQQKIFQDPAAPACGTLKTSALSFLTQSKDISEKVPPVLGYQPGSIVENMSSYTKVEQCVRTVCEKTLKQIQSTGQSVQSCTNQSNESRMTKGNTPRCSSPAKTAGLAKEEKQPAAKKPSSRPSTPVKKPSRPSTPVKKTSRPSTPVSQSNITVSSAQQVFHPSSTSSTSTSTSQVSAETKATTSSATTASSSSSRQHFFTSSSQTKSMAASHITHNLSKTLTAIASKHQSYNISSKNLSTSITSSDPNQTGSNVGAGYRTGTSAGLSAPRRGKGVWNPQNSTPGARIPLCAQCSSQIRGPFITALGKIWCPEHFICVNQTCRRSLLDIGFVEEPSGLHCEYCFEKYLAPTCGKCSRKIKGDCLNAIGKHFHPECFVCAYCNKLFGNSPFFLEEGLPYCENDWNELFTTKCFACGFPIEAGDRWVEALNNNYHSPCFNCTTCKTNLEGQSFYAKGGRPFCKSHAR